MRRLITALCSLVLLAACRPSTVGENMKRLRSKDYVRELKSGEYKVEIRSIPEALYYLTFGSLEENRRYDRSLLDSLKNGGIPGYGLMFSLTLSPRIDSLSPTDYRNDVVFGQVAGDSDYKRILEEFNSGLYSKVWLEVGNRRHEIRTYHMTNSWGMAKSRTFNLVFDPLEKLLPGNSGKVSMVIENLVPGQGRERVDWVFPIHQGDFL